MRKVVLEIVRAVRKARTILISTHERADGDALGSELAFLELALNMGKAAEVVNPNPVPSVYSFLPLARRVRKAPARARRPDLAVALDVPSLNRLRGVARLFPRASSTVNIDHHLDNANFATWNWVDTSRSCVGEMVLDLAQELGCVTPTMAANLYVALVTDTGRFTFSNTSARSFAAAKRLLAFGADPHAIAVRLYQSAPEKLVRLSAHVASTLRTYDRGRIAVMELAWSRLRRSGVSPLDTQDFSDMPRDIEGVCLGVFFREEAPRFVKVSLRAKDDFDVARIARLFGGGGHRAAAGFTLEMPLADARAAVLKALRRA
ncbi:MAG: bifunctional oligoribonuclease/PAP phosphatase NrnA [Planctomycetota bacterium]